MVICGVQRGNNIDAAVNVPPFAIETKKKTRSVQAAAEKEQTQQRLLTSFQQACHCVYYGIGMRDTW